MKQDDEATPNELLREARQKKKLTQQALAQMIGARANNYSRWERGIAFPNPYYRQKLSKVLGKSLEELGLVKQNSNQHQVLAPPKDKQEYNASDQEALDVLEAQHASITFPYADRAMQQADILGRDEEIFTIHQLLQGKRLITLTGTAGVGKTRLALALVDKLTKEDPAFTIEYISLASLEPDASIFPTLALRLGIREGRGLTSLSTAIKNFIHTPYFLLVLDNFEHVLTNQENAELIIDLLSSELPNFKLLITSRTPLNIERGSLECVFPVKSLPVPTAYQVIETTDLDHYAATQLFCQVAQMQDGAIADAHKIVAICQALEGLPLAIRIAASWIKTIGVRKVEQQVSSPEVLDFENKERFVPDRQKTLWITFSWSYRFLNEEQQRVFRYLAVFRGGCDLEALAYVCEKKEQEIREIARALIDCSMVETDEKNGEVRLVLLRPVYEFALALLVQEKEDSPAKKRHRDYYLSVTEWSWTMLRGSRQKAYKQELDNVWDDINAAFLWSQTDPQGTTALLRFAGGLLWYWFWPYTNDLAGIETKVQTGREWLYIALDRPDMFDNESHPKDPEAYATALFARGVLDLYTFTQASIAGKSGFLPLAEMVSNGKFFEEIAQLFREAKEVMHNAVPNNEASPMQIEEPRKAAALIQGMEAIVEYCLEDRKWALEALDACLNIFEESPNLWEIAWTMMQQGYIALGEGYYKIACLLFEESMKLFAKSQDDYGARCMFDAINLVELFSDQRRNAFFRARQNYAPKLLTKRIPEEKMSRAMHELAQEEWVNRRELSSEDELLLAEYEGGVSIEDIAAKHQRTPIAIRVRLIQSRQIKHGIRTEVEDYYDIMAEAQLENFHREHIAERASLFFYFQDMAFKNKDKLSPSDQL